MTAVAVPPAAPAAPAALDRFLAAVRSGNPFTENRVSAAGDAADVPAIHRTAFDRLTALAADARSSRVGLGAVLWGEAGVGKSHLLGRLARWADAGHVFCIPLHNLQADPDHLPRSLLRAVVSILTFGRVRRLYGTPLFVLVRAALREALQPNVHRSYTFEQLRPAWISFVDRLAAEDASRPALIDRTTFATLFRFFRSAHEARERRDDGLAALAVRWLSGDWLDPDEARRLSLPPGPGRDAPAGLTDNQQIKLVLVALARLAQSAGRPLLLCFDQVDNLDEAQAAALSRFLEALLDSAANLLVVTTGVQATLLRWREQKVFQDSAWDRLAQFQVGLQRIGPAEARQLVIARLDAFLRPFADLEPVRRRREQDGLFPLGEGWYAAALRDRVDVRPRDVLTWAREGWRRQQEALERHGGPAWLDGWPGDVSPVGNGEVVQQLDEGRLEQALDERVAQKIQEHVQQRLAQPESLPPDAENLAGIVYALLRQCIAPDGPVREVQRLPARKYGAPQPYQLVVRTGSAQGPERTLGLLFLNGGGHANRTTGYLRRLLSSPQPPTDGVLLITDQRAPLATGDTGQDYLEQLRRRGPDRFREVELSFEQYVALEALQAVAGQARSGELEVEVAPGQLRRLTEAEVIVSHRRQGRYAALPPLREVLGG